MSVIVESPIHVIGSDIENPIVLYQHDDVPEVIDSGDVITAYLKKRGCGTLMSGIIDIDLDFIGSDLGVGRIILAVDADETARWYPGVGVWVFKRVRVGNNKTFSYITAPPVQIVQDPTLLV